jgi:hypothetical protein
VVVVTPVAGLTSVIFAPETAALLGSWMLPWMLPVNWAKTAPQANSKNARRAPTEQKYLPFVVMFTPQFQNTKALLRKRLLRWLTLIAFPSFTVKKFLMDLY